jgi:hypothetical protein
LLLKSLTNYAIDELRKRLPGGGSRSPAQSKEDSVSLEWVDKPAADPFDIAWAREMLSQALRTMRVECDAQGCPERWLLFHRRVLQPMFDDQKPPVYDDLLREFQFVSPQQASNALITAKRHFQRALCQVVGEYAESDAEISLEIIDLRAIVQAAGPLNMDFGQLAAGGAPQEFASRRDDSTQHVRQLAELLVIEKEPDSLWRVDDYPSLWRHQLSQPLTSVLAVAGQVQQSEKRQCVDRNGPRPPAPQFTVDRFFVGAQRCRSRLRARRPGRFSDGAGYRPLFCVHRRWYRAAANANQ